MTAEYAQQGVALARWPVMIEDGMSQDAIVEAPAGAPAADWWAEIPAEVLPDETQVVTEDDTPVDPIFAEKQQRLLTESLYRSWRGPGEGRPFLALANGGLFYALTKAPLVPDVVLSLDVQAPADLWPPAHRSYFVWRYGKVPEVVIEVVSNRKGKEDSDTLRDYAGIGIPFYVIFDPAQHLSDRVCAGWMRCTREPTRNTRPVGCRKRRSG